MPPLPPDRSQHAPLHPHLGGLAAAAAAAGAAALYYSSSTAHAETAAAAKTRFDAAGFGSPSFKGDVVIVTGGTTGIGAACCAHLAKGGRRRLQH